MKRDSDQIKARHDTSERKHRSTPTALGADSSAVAPTMPRRSKPSKQSLPRYKPTKGERRVVATPDGRRTRRISIMLTDREMALVQRHLERKKVKNRARYLRNIWLKEILRQLKLSPPTLFDDLQGE